MPDKELELRIGDYSAVIVSDVSQGDTSWNWVFTVRNSFGELYAPAVRYAILAGHKPDGHAFAYLCNKVGDTYVLPPANYDVQMTAAAGLVSAELHLIDNSGRGIGTCNFTIHVERGPEGSVSVASASSLPAYLSILQKIGNFPPNLAQYVSDWLAENVLEGAVVDNTFTIEGAAAPAKLTGDRLRALEDATIETDATLSVEGAAADSKAVGDALTFSSGSDADFADIEAAGTLKGYMTANQNTIQSASADDCRCVYYPVQSGRTYRLRKTMQSKAAYVVAFTANTPAVGATLFNKQALTWDSEWKTIVNNSYSYLVVYYTYNDPNPDEILASITLQESSTVGLKTKINQIETGMNRNASLFNRFIQVSELNLSDSDLVTACKGILDAGSWTAGSSGYLVEIDRDIVSEITIEAQPDHSAGYAFLQNNNTSGSAPNYCSGFNKPVYIAAGNTATLSVPVDANYIWIQHMTMSNVDLTPVSVVLPMFILDSGSGASERGDSSESSAALVDCFNSVGFCSDSNGRDIPQHQGVRNAYKRAHQMIDLNWSALAVIPTDSSATGCPAGSHKGVLYSEALQFEKYVPYGCSIRTYMTALHNPYSVMYTEDTKGTAARKKSAYGFDYLNTTLNGAFYGTVCTAFTSGVLGSELIWQSYDHAWAAKHGYFVEVYDNSATGARLMDVLWTPGHCRIVTDIYRDEKGNPTQIHVSESTHDYVTSRAYSPAGFNALIQNGTNPGKLYRYTKLYQNINYEPSPFVAVDGETLDGEYQYNDAICTYLGDYVSIADWEKMFINYSKDAYTSMELYKGDTLIKTFTLPGSYNATHSIDVTSSLTGAGEYKARLVGDGISSDYTYFEVVDTNVTASMDGGKLTLTYSSSNGSPLYCKLKTISGAVKATYVFGENERLKGKCTFDPNALREAQGRSAFSGTIYARVFFNGKYNQVIGDYVDAHIA